MVADVTRCIDRLQPNRRIQLCRVTFRAETELLPILDVLNQVLALPRSFLIYCWALIIIRLSLKLWKLIEYVLFKLVIIQMLEYLWLESLTTVF